MNFESFCTRMWLDYADETSSFGSITLDKEEYVRTYNDWLRKKYAEQLEKQ
jgi:hypothetical protein|tara:strand:- start:27 stop:179 length:153 start_codon:yes stop_codon:yes gene_type:complete